MAVCKRNIGKSLIVFLAILLCPLISNSGFCSDKMSRSSLRGIKEIFVLIEKLPDELEKTGLTRDQIKTDVELKLRMAGIRVVQRKEGVLMPKIAYLYINLTALKSSSGLFICYLQVSLEQTVFLARDPNTLPYLATTWSKGEVGSVSASNTQDIRNRIKDHVDEFINDYLAENSK